MPRSNDQHAIEKEAIAKRDGENPSEERHFELFMLEWGLLQAILRSKYTAAARQHGGFDAASGVSGW